MIFRITIVLILATIIGILSSELYAQSFDNVRFEDVLKRAGIKSTGSLAHGATWVDVNADGCIDLVAANTNIRKPPRTYLFLNNCDGSFSNIDSAESGISDYWFIKIITAADYNNDGNIDLVLGGTESKGYPFLYQNTGDGKFTNVSDFSNVIGQGVINSLTWADYDLDGWVDLFQGGHSKYLYKNMGNGWFNEIALEAGISNYSKNLSSLWFDYNNDRYPDLFLSNLGVNTLYRNNGDNTFTDVTSQANLYGDADWKSNSACSGDFNNDGFLDLYVVNISSDRKALYKNNGDGTFTDITEKSRTGDIGDGRTCAFIDYNSDGWLDIFTTNHIQPSKLYRNNGHGTFVNKSFVLGIDKPIDAFSATWGDFNSDTKPDVFLNGHIYIALYKSSNFNNSIVIELVGNGVNTNTSAIGSRVKVTSGEITQIREVSGGKGCCENNMLPQMIGLGNETSFNLTVTWTNGDKCEFKNLLTYDAVYYKVNQNNCDLISY